MRVAEGARPLLVRLARLESALLREKIEATPITRPIYIAGMARAGSTMLLEALAACEGVATHRYRDFPFTLTPYLWDRMARRLPTRASAPAERAHADGITITPDSPEAMEEMVWMAFFPDAHNPRASNVLGADTQRPAFAQFYRDHIRKLLLARGAARYVAKGNYNVTRLGYLHALFPEARFILPVRAPAQQVESLLRQHARFQALAAQDPRVARYLRLSGHFEFGPDARFLHTGAYAPPLGDPGQDARVWAQAWNGVYAHAAQTLAENPGLAARTQVVKYEDLCAAPASTLAKLTDFCGLRLPELAAWAARIHAPDYYTPALSEAQRAAIHEETAPARAHFGYA